jgi:hypothetical protein
VIGTRLTVAALRLLHGLFLTAGMVMSGWLLIAVLEARIFRGLLITRAPEYLVLYTGWLIAQLLMAWYAWRRFDKCAFRTSVALYVTWLAFFVWHGWLTEGAPFRLHEVLIPGHAWGEYTRISIEISLWVIGFAIFPGLRYAISRSDRTDQQRHGPEQRHNYNPL